MGGYYCPRCERPVEIRPEHLTPAIPAMVPAIPEAIWLRDVVGHRCDERDVQGRLAADLADLSTRRDKQTRRGKRARLSDREPE